MYIKKIDDEVVEAPSFLVVDGKKIYGYNAQKNEKMLLNDGYIWYGGSLQLSNIDIIEGEIIEIPIIPTLQNYDDLMEEKLQSVRVQRGYTVREPSLYINSSNSRWQSDAQDWVAYVDEVMEYGLKIMAEYENTGIIPDLADFEQNLPQMNWSYEE